MNNSSRAGLQRPPPTQNQPPYPYPPPAATDPTLEAIAEVMRQQHSDAMARRWLQSQQAKAHAGKQAHLYPTTSPATAAPKTLQEPFLEHSSHTKATELLEPVREALGPAYTVLHAIARWSIENASEKDSTPHLMTTYWTLEEMTGLSERTLRRHLVEATHPWSNTVRKYIDIRHNYGKMLCGKDENGQPITRTVISSTVIRFFPEGRKSPNAKVKRWGVRDLMAESDAGRTRNTRPPSEKKRYERQKALLSGYSSITEQARTHKWCLVKLGQTVSDLVEQTQNYASLYTDIPRNHLLNALRSDLGIAVERAFEKGMNVRRSRALWVDTAGSLLATRFGDGHCPKDYVPTVPIDAPVAPGKSIGYRASKRKGVFYPVYQDGFTNLWRKALWTAIRAELYGGTNQGWVLLERMCAYASEAQQEGKRKPTAWAWSLIKRQGFAELMRDYDTGAVA